MSSPVIIIVGAGPGIGAATAHRFAAAGYDIGLIARDGERVGKLASALDEAGTRVGYATVDVSDTAALAHALEAMGEHNGRLDALLYNPAVVNPRPLSRMPASGLLADLQVGAAGLLTSLQAVLPLLRTQHTGTVLATTRGSGVHSAALGALVSALSAELSGEGIHVATVAVNGPLRAPGPVTGPISPDLVAAAFLDLVAETAQDPATWRTRVELGPGR